MAEWLGEAMTTMNMTSWAVHCHKLHEYGSIYHNWTLKFDMYIY